MPSDVNPYESPQVHVMEREEQSDDDKIRPFRSPRAWRLVVAAGLGLSMALSATTLWLTWQSLNVEDAVREAGTLEWLNPLFGALYVCRLITAIPFIVWMYCAYRNLPALGHDQLDSKFSWVILCWFIPIMNWFCPYLVMVELYRRSRPAFNPAHERQPAAVLVKSWWGSFVISLVVAWLPNMLDSGIETFWLDSTHLLFTAISAGLAIWIIFEIDSNQAARFKEQMSAPRI